MRFGFGQVGLSMESVYLELLVCGLALDKSVCQWSRCIWSYWFAVWLWTSRFVNGVGVFGAIGLRFGFGQVGLSMESACLELLVCALAFWTSRFVNGVGAFGAIGLRFGFGQVGLSMESVYLELLVCGLALDKSVCQWSRCVWSYWFAVWLWTSRFVKWSRCIWSYWFAVWLWTSRFVKWSRCIWSYWFAVWLWTSRFGSWSVGVFGA